MQKLLNTSPQSFDELLRAVELIAGQINDNVGLEPGDELSETAAIFLSGSIDACICNRIPSRMLPIGPLEAAADARNRMCRFEKQRREIASDVPCSTDDDDVQRECSFALHRAPSGQLDTATRAHLEYDYATAVAY